VVDAKRETEKKRIFPEKSLGEENDLVQVFIFVKINPEICSRDGASGLENINVYVKVIKRDT